MFDIVCIGHLSIDSITLPSQKRPHVTLGGSATYASLAASCLGAKVSIVSKVGVDFPEDYRRRLKQCGVDSSGIVAVENARTTRFELKYSDDLSSRVLRLKNRAPPIMAEDLPKSLKAKAIHAAPIAGEIDYETSKRLREQGNVLSVDPQGLLRSFDKDGNVALRSLVDEHVLDLFDVLKCSETEISVLTDLGDLHKAIGSLHKHGAKIVIVTCGEKGAFVSDRRRIRYIPTYEPEKSLDPTGAGDVFVGAFLTEYIRGGDWLWCSCVGAAAASVKVESVGPSFPCDKKEIYRRASVLYEKGIK